MLLLVIQRLYFIYGQSNVMKQPGRIVPPKNRAVPGPALRAEVTA
jgi:hypothetical protein